MAKLYDADAMMAEELYNNLSKRQKVAHFWTYYKNIVLVIVFMIALAAMVYALKPVTGPEDNLRIQFVNAYLDGWAEEDNSMEMDYNAYLAPDNISQMALSYCEIRPDDPMRADVNMDKVMSKVGKWSVEILVLDEYALNNISPTGFLRDLNICLDSTVLEQVQERIIYRKNSEGIEVPVAIDITDTEYVKRVGIQGESVYISFAVNCPNEELSKQFVTYILSE